MEFKISTHKLLEFNALYMLLSQNVDIKPGVAVTMQTDASHDGRTTWITLPDDILAQFSDQQIDELRDFQ